MLALARHPGENFSVDVAADVDPDTKRADVLGKPMEIGVSA